MIPLFFKYFFIILCCTFGYYKISKCSVSNTISYLLFTCIIALTTSFIPTDSSIFRVLLTFISLFAVYTIYYKNAWNKSLIYLTISMGMSFVFLTVSNTIMGIILLLQYQFPNAIQYSKTDLPIGLLQFLLTVTFYRNKRLQKGITLLISNKKVIIGLILSFTFIIFISIVSNVHHDTSQTRGLVITIILILAILLIYYWHHRITQTYREKMCLVYEKSLENEIVNLKEEIKTLQADNQRLTQIVHKDNKLVPAMESTILEFLQSASTLSAEELSARGSELSGILHEMATNRTGILTSLSPSRNGLPCSGLLSIDGLLSYMGNRANENKIDYRVKRDNNIKDMIPTTIQEEDLRHLLSDLIENAIIAVKCSELPGYISIHLGNLQDKFLIEISDSGIPFSPETYQHWGYEHCSTHKDTGGTGTGLLDIWNLKKKYKASLYIYEYENDSNIYTKKISFLFDGKNHFLLKTYREKEIRNTLFRGDLHVFPHNPE